MPRQAYRGLFDRSQPLCYSLRDMLTIRLQRTGRRNDPAFRIIAVEKTASPKVGTYTDLLGTYNPRSKAITVAEDRVKDWISKGAQLSPSLSNLLIAKGVIEGKKVSVVSKSNLEKNKPKEEPKEEPVAEAPKAEESTPAEAPAEAAPAVEEAPAEAAPAPEAPAEEPAPVEAPADETPA
jgi:small subunit ribosomal protein S16